MSGIIAVINAGSSSIKFALYAAGRFQTALFRGQVEQIGVSPHLRVCDAAGETVAERRWPGPELDHKAATEEILRTVAERTRGSPVLGVGHRVVHGGVHYAEPVRVDAEVMAALAALSPLAPLHQPHNLSPIQVISRVAPQIPQVACFDTAFHR